MWAPTVHPSTVSELGPNHTYAMQFVCTQLTLLMGRYNMLIMSNSDNAVLRSAIDINVVYCRLVVFSSYICM